jgi:hypothetical protein
MILSSKLELLYASRDIVTSARVVAAVVTINDSGDTESMPLDEWNNRVRAADMITNSLDNFLGCCYLEEHLEASIPHLLHDIFLSSIDGVFMDVGPGAT